MDAAHYSDHVPLLRETTSRRGSYASTPSSSSSPRTSPTPHISNSTFEIEADGIADVVSDNVRNKPNTDAAWRAKYIWDSLDKPPAERRLLFKLDTCLLTLASLGYMIKSLDSSNLTSAYVSGMKEDLGMHGNQYNTAVALWTVGYAIGQVPSNLILTRVSPRFWIPFIEMTWSLFTLAAYRVQTPQQLYFIRFCIGLFESAFYPGMHYIMGSWYRPDELGKRSVIFHTAGGVGSMLSGFLQAAAFTYLRGKGGLEGWRWLMILCFFLSAPVAIAGAIFLIDMPWKAQPNWLFTEMDLKVANIRLAKEGRAPASRITRAKVKKIASSWHIWVLPWLFVFWNNAGGLQHVMPFWLKSYNKPGQPPVYTVPQINTYPIPMTVIYTITALAMAWTSDGILNGRRWPAMLFGSTVNVFVAIALLITPLYGSEPLRFTLYYLTGISAGQSGLPFAWASEICSADTEERSLVIASMNDLAYIFQAWVPLIVWKQTDMPRALKGTIYSICMSTMHVLWTFLVMHLSWRDIERKEKQPQRLRSDSEADEAQWMLPPGGGK